MTRDRKNRAIYVAFSGDQKKFGKKRCYGEKVNLIQGNTQLIADNVTTFDNVLKKGVVTKVVLREYRNLLVKGRNPHSMKDKAVNYVKAEVYDLEGNKIYKNDLLICVSGSVGMSYVQKKCMVTTSSFDKIFPITKTGLYKIW